MYVCITQSLTIVHFEFRYNCLEFLKVLLLCRPRIFFSFPKPFSVTGAWLCCCRSNVIDDRSDLCTSMFQRMHDLVSGDVSQIESHSLFNYYQTIIHTYTFHNMYIVFKCMYLHITTHQVCIICIFTPQISPFNVNIFIYSVCIYIHTSTMCIYKYV